MIRRISFQLSRLFFEERKKSHPFPFYKTISQNDSIVQYKGELRSRAKWQINQKACQKIYGNTVWRILQERIEKRRIAYPQKVC